MGLVSKTAGQGDCEKDQDKYLKKIKIKGLKQKKAENGSKKEGEKKLKKARQLRQWYVLAGKKRSSGVLMG